MTMRVPPPEIPIRLFQTQLHECGYYPERQARNLVLDPHSPYLAQAYANAVDHGFRRSSGHIYRPHCPDCDACTASRIEVQHFQPDRSQRRCLRRNEDLSVHWRDAVPDDEALYVGRLDVHVQPVRSCVLHRCGG